MEQIRDTELIMMWLDWLTKNLNGREKTHMELLLKGAVNKYGAEAVAKRVDENSDVIERLFNEIRFSIGGEPLTIYALYAMILSGDWQSNKTGA